MTAFLALALSAAPAAGQAPPPPPTAEQQARALYEQGLRFYNGGDFDTAITLWQQAFELTMRAAILHNIAMAYEEAGQPAAALAAWEQYRKIAPPDQQAMADARITALEVVVATLSAPAPGPVPADPPPEELAERERELKPRRSLRGLAAGSLGAAAAGAVVGGSLLSRGATAQAGTIAQQGCVEGPAGTLCDGAASEGLAARRLRFALGLGLVGGGVGLGAGSVLVAVRPGHGAADAALTLEGTW